MREPLSIYINWASYDELSDSIELTEELAMQQLHEYIRLRSKGVRFDYYLMDAFWFDPDGGFRKWRTPHWPKGPDKWLETCRKNDVKPGLWFPTNLFCKVKPIPSWEGSFNRDKWAACMFDGPYLADLFDALQMWVDKGIKLFKFDFAQLDQATPEAEKTFTPVQIQELNAAALQNAIAKFRRKNPDVVFLAYNGFGGDGMDNTSKPLKKSVDERWLSVFDSLYCGDPRPADIPAMNFWRSKDIYSDHQVRYYEANNIPLERIDNTSFMIGKTGTCYYRGTAAWKGMLVLSLARGGWMNTYYGNLELLDDQKAAWFAKAQALYYPLQSFGKISSFGGIPGKAEAYGYAAVGSCGSLYTIVNPSQSMKTITLSETNSHQAKLDKGRILFSDDGFVPVLDGTRLTLGPEQLCVVGFGCYNDESNDLGRETDCVVPSQIAPVAAEFRETAKNEIAATIDAPAHGDLRIMMQQFNGNLAHRLSGGPAPSGTTLAKLLKIIVTQDGKSVSVKVNYDKAIWSGLSWAAGEISGKDFKAGVPVHIVCSSTEEKKLRLEGSVYQVKY